MTTVSPYAQDDNPPLKYCSGCPEGQQWHPATPEYFYRNKDTKDGLQSQCKTCVSKKQKIRDSLPEVQERHAAYEKARPSRKAWDKAYRSRPESRKRKRAYMKDFHQSPKAKEYWTRPEVKARRSVNSLTRVARKKGISGTYTPEQIQSLLKRQKYRCYYCSTKFKKVDGKYVYQVDHTFPLSRVVGMDIPANDISYLVLTCPSCNQSKGNKFPWEWSQGGRLL